MKKEKGGDTPFRTMNKIKNVYYILFIMPFMFFGPASFTRSCNFTFVSLLDCLFLRLSVS